MTQNKLFGALIALLILIICLPSDLNAQSKRKKRISTFLNVDSKISLKTQRVNYFIAGIGDQRIRLKQYNRTMSVASSDDMISTNFYFDRKGSFVRAESLSRVKAIDEKLPNEKVTKALAQPKSELISEKRLSDEILFDKIWDVIQSEIPIADAEEFCIYSADLRLYDDKTVDVIVFEGWGFSKPVMFRDVFRSETPKNRIRLYISMEGKVLFRNNVL